MLTNLPDGTAVELNRDNWNDVAFQARQIQSQQLGRSLTSHEAIAIIEQYRDAAQGYSPTRYDIGAQQAAASITFSSEFQKTYVAPTVEALKSAGDFAQEKFMGLSLGVVILLAVGLAVYMKVK